MCNGVTHNLRSVFRTPYKSIPGGELIVRWCEDCGSVVIDVDVDGRTYPGKIMRMKVPSEKKKQLNQYCGTCKFADGTHWASSICSRCSGNFDMWEQNENV